MKNSLKYGVTITIAAIAVSLVQFVCEFLGLNIDINILIDVASVIIAVLIVLGVIKRSEDIDAEKLRGEIKDDIEDKLDELDAKKSSEDTLLPDNNSSDDGQESHPKETEP